MRSTLGSSLLSALICALLWMIISFATGGSALFAIGGAVAVGAIIFIVGYAFRRMVFDRRKADSGVRRS